MAANYPIVVYVTKTTSDPRAASDINQLQDDVKAHADDYVTGWITAGETWVFATTTTFTVTGDRTSKYRKGCKIKLTQTSAKYFYVVASVYSSPSTTVTVAGGSDYTLANATITSPFYSYADCPQDFPDWFNWAGAASGFSASSTHASRYFRFCARGKTCFATYDTGTSSISDSASFALNIPIVAASVDTWAANWDFPISIFENGGSISACAGRASITELSPSVGFFSNMGAGTWVSTGSSKRARGILFYEF